jgi:hypothetical protein
MADLSSPPSSPVAGTQAAEPEHESLIWIDRPKYVCASCGCDLALQVSVCRSPPYGQTGQTATEIIRAHLEPRALIARV